MDPLEEEEEEEGQEDPSTLMTAVTNVESVVIMLMTALVGVEAAVPADQGAYNVFSAIIFLSVTMTKILFVLKSCEIIIFVTV